MSSRSPPAQGTKTSPASGGAIANSSLQAGRDIEADVPLSEEEAAEEKVYTDEDQE